MNRNRSLGVSNISSNHRGNNSNNIDRNSNLMPENTGITRMNEFDRMFENFGMPRLGMGNIDNFFSSRFDDLESDIFSNFHQQISTGGRNMQGTVITKSYVSKVNYDDSGRPQRETFQTQSIKQTDQDGKKIKEKQQAYQNSKSGVQKAAHERVLNDKGVKIIKARNRNTGEEYEHNVFKGLKEDEVDSFNNEYNDYRNKTKFDKNYEYLNEIGSKRSLPQNNNNNNEDINNRRGDYSKYNPKPNPKTQNQKEYNALPGRR